MAYIDWTDYFSVNIREFDFHHKTLVQKINMLHQSLLDNRGREVQAEIIERMAAYADLHFTAEEKHMLRLNYPGYQQHTARHGTFREMTADLQKRIDSSGTVLTMEILSYLKSWLQEHILVVDKEYSQHFNLNGVY